MINQPTELTLNHVKQALFLPDFDVRDAWLRMAPRARPLERPPDMAGQVRNASVLLLVYPIEGVLTFALTHRTDHVATHKGQVSLPGGAVEAGESLPDAALRETCEEVHVCLDTNALIGALAPLYVIVSDFKIHPYVGYLPERPDFRPDPVEVAAMVEAPLPLLLDDRIKDMERWTIRGADLDVPFYRIAGHKVWGATAAILSEFEGRLRRVLNT